ncbi:MAG: adenosine kinase [Candidatus Heimdallarchaeota archaeon]
MDKEFDVYGIGNPLIDLLVQISTQKLESLSVHKGVMNLIDLERRQYLLNNLSDWTVLPGGSCANTIIALSDLGLNTVYGGSIGRDNLGEQFEENMSQLGVTSALRRKVLPTGSSIILITEDADRSQNTYLGACQEYSIEDVDIDKIRKSKSLYFTGYMWDTESQKRALLHAIDVAKDSNTEIIFDVADPFAVNRSKDDFIKLMKYDVDFIFANFEEAKTLTGEITKDSIIEKMKEMGPSSGVVKDGKRGSYAYKDDKVFDIDVYQVKAVDTTGAGDMYAAGFIYGMARNYGMQKSGEIASLVAGKVVEQVGARLGYSLKEIIN